MFGYGCGEKRLRTLDHMREGNWKIAGADLAKFMFDRFSYRGESQEFCVVFFH